ncbi:chloride channel protein [Massilia terrae]|uniref:Chloride channel protein n=1 Tax=Massilia terrae TaxID=1811224 RepID=A0ABT2CU55_9BURK|nr:chloride channel protein [Massilia terrae]MCS0657506.1 chloride channel protein [Massilia terrae]
MSHYPHLSGAALRREFADWRLWWGRGVVVAMAVLAGLTVVGFTSLCEFAAGLFGKLYPAHWWLPLLVSPAVAAGVVWLTRRVAPGAAGSGIPQVMASLEPEARSGVRGLFVSLRLTVAKIVLTAGGLLGGLSLGREGPSVQIAAGVMLQARRFMPPGGAVNAHGLLVAGGAAGIAAAFNTPLAGVMFAIEELARSPERRSSGLLIAAIVLAGLIAVSAHGNSTYFGVIHAQQVGLALLAPGLLVTVLAGLAGGGFSRLLVASMSGQGKDIFTRLRNSRPVVFAAVCGLLVATIGIVTAGATFGSGYASTRRMVEGAGAMPFAYALFKFCATWITSWSGVPAGIFAPSLAIGAAIGNDVALLTSHAQVPALIALGMVGFLAAATQAPLTAFIIVMEMVDGHAMVLSLMACALVARVVARTVSPPLYPTLARFQLARIPPKEEPGAK